MRQTTVLAMLLTGTPAVMAAPGASHLISIGAAANGGATEGVGFLENFEGFDLGSIGQFGWTGFGASIVNSGVAGFGSRSVSVPVNPNGSTNETFSPDFGDPMLGVVAADFLMTVDNGTTVSFATSSYGVSTIQTRVLFQPGGAIDVLQLVGMNNEFLSTSGSWSAGVVTQIAIEVLAGNVLNLYQDGALIFSGHDIVQQLGHDVLGADGVWIQNWGGGGRDGGYFFDNLSFTPIPTPGALGLFGIAGLAAARRRR